MLSIFFQIINACIILFMVVGIGIRGFAFNILDRIIENEPVPRRDTKLVFLYMISMSLGTIISGIIFAIEFFHVAMQPMNAVILRNTNQLYILLTKMSILTLLVTLMIVLVALPLKRRIDIIKQRF